MKFSIDGCELESIYSRPQNAIGIVIFVHGSGSSRFSPRNQFVSKILNDKKIATLLIDLLTQGEEEIDELTRSYRFDINLLANRLIAITKVIAAKEKLPIGYFGASTGAAAAIIAASEIESISSLVSRGGRPDLASSSIPNLKSPILYLIGEKDPQVIFLNKKAFEKTECEKKMMIIPNATHLFEEPGCLEHVASISAEWFLTHFLHLTKNR